MEIQKEAKLILKKFGHDIPTGNVIITSAGTLPFKKIIHAVGPIWTVLNKGEHEREALMRITIHNTLEIAAILGVESIALPAISTGCYRFPKHICAQIMFQEAIRFAER